MSNCHIRPIPVLVSRSHLQSHRTQEQENAKVPPSCKQARTYSLIALRNKKTRKFPPPIAYRVSRPALTVSSLAYRVSRPALTVSSQSGKKTRKLPPSYRLSCKQAALTVSSQSEKRKQSFPLPYRCKGRENERLKTYLLYFRFV